MREVMPFGPRHVGKGESRVVYIAAPFDQREQAQQLKEFLESLGHVTTSAWITSHYGTYDEVSPEVAAVEAHLDLEAIRRAEVLILINGASTSGGMHLEMGYAIAAGKGILVWGAPSSIFHHLPGVRVVEGSMHVVADALTRYFVPAAKGEGK